MNAMYLVCMPQGVRPEEGVVVARAASQMRRAPPASLGVGHPRSLPDPRAPLHIREAVPASGLPNEVGRFAVATWDRNEVRIATAPPDIALVRIRSGVAQGCPLSSTLFAVSFEPLLELLARASCGVDLVKACADDVGAISSWLSALRTIPQALEVMRRASGLEPAPKKTQLLLLAPNLPDPWSEMRITTAASYLGAVVGPTAGSTA